MILEVRFFGLCWYYLTIECQTYYFVISAMKIRPIKLNAITSWSKYLKKQINTNTCVQFIPLSIDSVNSDKSFYIIFIEVHPNKIFFFVCFSISNNIRIRVWNHRWCTQALVSQSIQGEMASQITSSLPLHHNRAGICPI